MIAAQQRFAGGHFISLAALALDQAQVAGRGRPQFRGIENVDDVHLELLVAQQSEPFLETARIEEIAEHEDQPAPFHALGKRP